MQELIDRIEALEQTVRRWRATALVLGAILLSVLGLTVVEWVRQRQMMVEVIRREAVAREMAEVERLQAVQAQKGKQ